MFRALTFADILQAERALAEVNHCHGPGRGHPCTGMVTRAKQRILRRLTRDPRSFFGTLFGRPERLKPWRQAFRAGLRARPVQEAVSVADLTTEARAVLEAWSDAARQAAIRARQARAKYTTDVAATAKRRKEAAKAKAAAGAKAGAASASAAKKVEAEHKRIEAEHTRQARQAETEHRKAATAAKQQTAAQWDAKLRQSAMELSAMAKAGQKGTPAYRQKYEAHRALQDQKAVALGGSPRVEAPETPKKPKTPKTPAARAYRGRVVPTVRNRFRRVA